FPEVCAAERPCSARPATHRPLPRLSARDGRTLGGRANFMRAADPGTHAGPRLGKPLTLASQSPILSAIPASANGSSARQSPFSFPSQVGSMDVFVARQPIFDRHDRVVGYELLYRDHRESQSAPSHVTYDMSSRVIVDAFVGLGLHELT